MHQLCRFKYWANTHYKDAPTSCLALPSSSLLSSILLRTCPCLPPPTKLYISVIQVLPYYLDLCIFICWQSTLLVAASLVICFTVCVRCLMLRPRETSSNTTQNFKKRFIPYVLWRCSPQTNPCVAWWLKSHHVNTNDLFKTPKLFRAYENGDF